MRILISGGGIAGPALASWLARDGAEVTVERAAAPRPGGHAVDVRGAAKQVVERMGLMPVVRAARVEERGVALVDARGRRLAVLPAEAFGGEGMVAEIEISRGDLAAVLFEATAGHFRFGDRITSMRPDPAGVDVTFASGGAPERFDVVVGADGVRSAVRAMAFGPDERFVRPLGAYTAYFTVPDPGDLDGYFLMYNAPGGRVAGLRPERAGTVKAGLSFRTPKGGVGRLGRADQQRLLAERMAGAGWRVPEMLAAMRDAPDFYFDAISQVRVERWHRGRVVLLGDAGYCGSPLAGLGTSMSLVGAYVLAGELASARDPETAFAGYQRIMAGYVEQGLRLPPGGVRAFAPGSRLAIRLRAWSMAGLTRWPMRQLMAAQAAKADAIDLPDYHRPIAPRPAETRPAH